MKILVLGAGMYVTGRQGSGVGTVLASLLQASHEVDIESVTIVARAATNASVVADASGLLNSKLRSKVMVNYVSIDDQALSDVCDRESFVCAIVSTPDQAHYEQISFLMRRGIHVLCVKPLVPTVEENLALLQQQKSMDVLGIVEFHKRYDEANLYTRRLLQEGAIGRVTHYDVHYTQKISIPQVTFQNWVSHTNIFQYLGVHYVDLFYFFTGFRPIKAMAYGAYGALKDSGLPTWDSVHATVIWLDHHHREVVTIFNIGWADPTCTSAMSDQRFKLIGTSGRIENDHKHRGIEVVSSAGSIQHPNPYFSEFLPTPDGAYALSGYGYKSIKQFLDDVVAVSYGREDPNHYSDSRPTFEQCLPTTAVLEAVNNSLNSGSNWETINAVL